MSDEIFFDGKRYLPASDVARSSDFTRDYVARLCRDGKVRGKRVGKNWYVEHESFKAFLVGQEYSKSVWRESLAKQRVEEYATPRRVAQPGGIGSGADIQKSLSKGVRTLAASPVYSKLADAVAQQGAKVLGKTSELVSSPSGVGDAALRLAAQGAAHVPTYAVTPLAEFAHKLVALTLAVMLTFGTYASVDPQAMRVAADSLSGTVKKISDSYAFLTSQDTRALLQHAQRSVATAVENPRETAAAAASGITQVIPSTFEKLARAVNDKVNGFVYSIAFPQTLLASFGSQNGNVAVEVKPYARPASPALASAESPATQTHVTVIKQPVIQQTTERIIEQGGISEAELADKLNQLSNKLVAQIYSVTSAPNTPIASGGYTNTIAATNRIDHLSGITITNSTIDTASIPDLSGTYLPLGSTGTSTVAGNISVAGNINLNGALLQNNAPFVGSQWTTTGSKIYYNSGNVGVGTSSPWTNFSIHANNGDTNTTLFAVGSSTASATTTLFSISNAGNATLAGTLTVGSCVGCGGGGSDAFTHPASGQSATTSLLLFNGAASTSLLSVTSKAYFGGTSTTTIDSAGNIGVASSTPWANLAVNPVGGAASNQFVVGSSTATSFLINNSGNVGVGTTSPYAQLSVFAGGDYASHAASTLFAIGSSTAGTATTTLFSVNSAGSITTSLGSGLVKSTSGVFSLATAGTDYLSAYDAWTHPAAGQSATTSLVLLNGNASTTQLSVYTKAYFGGTSTTTIDSAGNTTLPNNGTLSVGSSTPWGLLSIFAGGDYASHAASTLFAIGSSTAGTATSTLFSVSNAGKLTLNGSGSFGDGTNLQLGDYTTFTTDSNGLTIDSQRGNGGLILNALGGVGIGRQLTSLTGVLSVVSGTASVSPNGKGIYLQAQAGSGISGIGGSVYVGAGQSLIPGGGKDGAILFGLGNKTTEGLYSEFGRFDTFGNFGVGTTSPYAQLSVFAGGDYASHAASTLFAIGSSTAGTATTTLFSVNNVGSITTSLGSGLVKSTSGVFSLATAGTDYLSAYDAWTHPAAGQSATTSLLLLNGNASTTQLSVYTKAYFGGTSTTTIDSAGNIGVASSTPWANLAVNPVGGAASNQFVVGSSTATSFLINNSGKVGIATTSPFSLFSINPNALASGVPAFTVGSSTATWFTVTNGGSVGVGTSTPAATFAVGGSTFLGGSLTLNSGSITYAAAATSTVVDSNTYAWTIATSSTGQPLFRIDTTHGSESLTFGGSGSDVVIGDVGAAANLVFEENSTIKGQTGGRVLTFGGSGDVLNFAVNTGFGSTTPYAALSIFADGDYASHAASTLFAIGSSTAGTATSTLFAVTSAGNVGIASTTPWAKLSINPVVGDTNPLFDIAAGGSPYFIVANSGDVGIGTTSPYGLLAVTRGGVSSEPLLNVGSVSTGVNLLVDSGGIVGIGTTTPWALLSVFAGGDYASHAASTLFAIGSSTAGTATSTLFSVNNAGLVGVGTTSPAATFAVNGSGFFNGSLNIAAAAAYQQGGNNILYTNTSNLNTAVGVSAGPFFSSAPTDRNDKNTAIGYSALQRATSTAGNITSEKNTAVGYQALQGSSDAVGITGSVNTGVGYHALGNITSGGTNSALGSDALSSLTTGSGNTAIGEEAMYGAQGSNNTAAGNLTLWLNSGSENTTFGASSGYSGTTAYGNTFFGFKSGYNVTSGFNNIALGYNALLPSATGNGQLNIGNLLFATLPATTTAFQLPTSGAIGIGTSTPWGKLSISLNNGDTNPYAFIIASSTASATTTLFSVSNVGNVGIGSSTPFALFSINPNGIGSIPAFVVGSTTATWFTVTNGGSVGIGTSTPFRRLSVTDTVSTAQVAVAYDATRYAEWRVDTTGDLNVEPSGGDIYLNNDNFWVCTGGSITVNGCPSGTPTGVGNLIVENKAGIGTTTPAYKFALETQDTTTNFFQIASSGAQSLFVVNANGYVGIGSSTPFGKLSVGAGSSIVTTENGLTDGATVAIDWLQGNQQKVTLGGNRTVTFSNYSPGMALRLVLCQDATGSRTITWPSVVLWQGGTAPTLTTTASKCDLVSFVTTSATGTVQVFGAAALSF